MRFHSLSIGCEKWPFLYGKIDEEFYESQPQVLLILSSTKVYQVVESFSRFPPSSQEPDMLLLSTFLLRNLKKFDFASVKTARPIETQKPLVKDEEASDVDVHLYRSMIGSLMYLTASRPDIMFAVSKGQTQNCAFGHPRVSSFRPDAYSDSDYAGANLDRKSTTGEAEYVAAANCVERVLWISKSISFNAEFHEIIDFLARSSIHNALTVSPVVSTTFVEQFWMSAKSKIINNVRYITAKVAGKPVSISEASIRSDLLFDDADGIDSLPNQAIFDAIQLMGYEGDLTVLTFNKALFSPQWRFLFHTMNHCISSKSTSWDQIPTNIATAVICLTSNQKYNFSKLIFDGMLRHLDAKKKFVMYPRFISVFLDTQLKSVPVPLDHFPVNALTSKVFSFMVKKGKHFSGKVTPLFSNMLVQPTEDEGEQSERPSEPQLTPSPPHPSEVHVEPQSDPSPRPSPTSHIPDSIPESSGGNHRGQSSSDKSLSGNEGDMTLQSVYDLCISLCTQVTDQAKEIQHLKAQIKKLKKKAKPVITHHKAWMKSVSLKQRLAGKKSLKKKWMQKESVSKQGRKSAKAEPTVHKDKAFDELDDDEIDNIKTEDAQDVLRTRYVVHEEKERKEKEVSTEDALSTDKEKDSTDRPDEGTVDQTEGRSATPTTPTPTPTTFRDDETIAQVLLNMSQAKAVSREKEKGVELKDVENIERPRPTSTRSLLTLKPLPKIDPKDKGKKKIEEDESDTESEDINETEKKFKMLAHDEEIVRKMKEDWETEEERKRLAEEEATNAALIQDFDDIKARMEADRLLALRLQEEERAVHYGRESKIPS
ncbi:putative ribonuclease H-like domain-containing protein [Tanacetum coccineum]|uniref:Ribonuclease H-like domain-containing protein n=1 Tax=Tanacetum coccineum TaxID=301880 RepID=A0ABQ5FM47_9ASTR